jgi:hypothetical protein
VAVLVRHRPVGVTRLAVRTGLAALPAVCHTLRGLVLHLLPSTLGELRGSRLDLSGASRPPRVRRAFGTAQLARFAELRVLVLHFRDGSRTRRVTGLDPFDAELLDRLGWPPATRYNVVHP